MEYLIFVVPILLILGFVEGGHNRGSYCTLYDTWGFTYYSYCTHGCCSYACCDKETELHGGAIAGIVIGCLLGAAILVVVLTICCIILCRKKNAPTGMIHAVGPNPSMVTTPYPNVHYVRYSHATGPYGNNAQVSFERSPNTEDLSSLSVSPRAHGSSHFNSTAPPSYMQTQHMKM